MSRPLLTIALVLAVAPAAAGQGFTPAEAVKRMTLPPGFTARVVAHEPTIRQPVSMSFDARGRLWVLQYLQYPNYAGLKPVRQDQYLRTVWDKFPEPPPRGPKGADRLTILSDPDENGVFTKSKDFVGGLNIASGFCLGHGGVYVTQPPYLLYYPDKNEDDIPDGDPEVLLIGFGMDDTHSLANSLQWGPDGWLYGAAGSTSTSAIKNPADPKAPPVEFQQGIWRYHPKVKRFELFSEGGGNTYGLDFDQHGQLIAGTNWGGFACLHQMQGAYYVKGFAKHGPLHNPHTYGYFDHVPYTGFKGGHVTNGGIVYQADAYPKEYRDQYIAANLLSNAVYWHKLTPDRASFKASHGGELLEANDTWFRPVDLIQGPDGSVYVADFTDRRAAHLDPVDNWDRTNGRIYKIEYQGTPKPRPFDLRAAPSAGLVELLSDSNVWYRREARRLLAERQDAATYPKLRQLAVEGKGPAALDALWTLYGAGGCDMLFLEKLLKHPDEHVRAWAVRLTTDLPLPEGQAGHSNPAIGPLAELAAREDSLVVRCQLACSARRMPVGGTLSVIRAIMGRDWDVHYGTRAGDRDPGPYLPLLCWWATEERCTAHPHQPEQLFTNVYPTTGSPLSDPLVERVARRLMAPDLPDGQKAAARYLENWTGERKTIVRGLAAAAEAGWAAKLDPELVNQLRRVLDADPASEPAWFVLARGGDPAAVNRYLERVADGERPEAERLRAVEVLKPVRRLAAWDLFRAELTRPNSDAIKAGLLGGLEAFDDPAVGTFVLAHYADWPAAVRRRAVQLLLARSVWALPLLKQLDAGTFPKADLSVDQARAAVGLGDRAVTALVEKHFGKLTAATAGEKLARIASLQTALGRTTGDPVNGKGLFTKHCAGCHTLHGEGGKVGPDLTTVDRKNRGYLLAQTVDPSGYIRPEYVVQNVSTLDGRKLSGVAAEVGGAVTLTTVVDNKPVTTTVPKADIESMTPSAVSLMPEKLLDTLSDAEVADLFAYLASDPKTPEAVAPGSPKKLTVCLVSGSFEYQSDASLDILQKEFERHGVRCTRATAKTETEITGLDHLATADAAVFFTRRLRLPEAELKKVKAFVESKKPVVGVRTASHGFQDWLEMDGLVYGGSYKGHYGALPGYGLTVVDAAKDHPILKGVSLPNGVGSLYKNPGVAADATVLLRGSIPDHAEPVAWAREKDGRRAVYTSLGHQDDFKNPAFVRLLVNALGWATKKDLAGK